MGKDPTRLTFASARHIVQIQDSYIKSIKDEDARKFLREQRAQGKGHAFKPDIQVCIDGEFVVSVECKAYAESAMLKRVILDAYLLQRLHSQLKFVLFMLESQLGGDYSSPLKEAKGSAATHSILSYFPQVDLGTIVLLEGERKVEKPIHEQAHHKSLKIEALRRSVKVFAEMLCP